MQRFNIKRGKSYEKDGKTIFPVIASNDGIDRDNESILTSAWDTKTYEQHPIILADHCYWTDNQIGEAKTITKGDDGLNIELEYYNGKGNQVADWCYFLAKQGMAAYSVGFMPKQWTQDKNDLVYTNWIESHGAGKTPGRIYTNVELLELSHVAVPSLREALQQNSALKYDTALEMGKGLYPEEAEFLQWKKKGSKSFNIPLIERMNRLEKKYDDLEPQKADDPKTEKTLSDVDIICELFNL